jgi:hypothetical protein
MTPEEAAELRVAMETGETMMAAARIDQDAGFEHVPVMLPEVLSAYQALDRGVFVDVTAGGGGHSRALLEAHRRFACSRSTATPSP